MDDRNDERMCQTLVSIIMPMYNNRAYVAEAVESALAQDYPNIELIVIDDGSTDGGKKVIEAFDDSRVRLERTENRGPSAARNRGVEISKGELITFLDSDDLLTTCSISSRVRALTEFCADAALSWNVRVERLGEGRRYHRLQRVPPKNPPRIRTAREFRAKIIDNRFSIGNCGLLMRKELFERAGGFDPSCRIHEDVELFSRIVAEEVHLVETFEEMYIYRPRSNSVSSIDSTDKAVEALRTLRKVCQNLRPWLDTHPESVGQKLFNRCVKAYPHWTEEHRLAMNEARSLMGGRPFDLSCVGGPRAQAVARLFGWRVGRFTTRASLRARRVLGLGNRG